MRRLRKVFGTLAAAMALSAQAAPSDALSLVKAQIRPIEAGAGNSYSGAAWSDLVEDAAGAQFVMVGEQHGSGSIALLASALHRELAQRGFTHSALEVGPLSTRFAERLIRTDNGKLHGFIGEPGHGFTLPFLFFAEEADLAEQMVRTSPDKQQALFGLDQEFVGAGPILADQLESVSRTPAQRQAVADLRAASAKDPMLIGQLPDAQLAALETAFAGNKAAGEVLDAIRISVGIYKPFMTKQGSVYAANLERETYMKRNFVRDFEAAKRRNGSTPKVFFKFGASHAMRGITITNVPGLGNFLAEWGLPQGYRTVNLFVDCVGGEAMNPQTNKAGPCSSYFKQDTLLSRAVADGPALQIVDLRALRPQLGKLKDADEESRKIILAFDYYIAVNGGRAATPLGKL